MDLSNCTSLCSDLINGICLEVLTLIKEPKPTGLGERGSNIDMSDHLGS